ncbi:hypothetical protein HanXRQr2_Chr05g0212421 [Helianthus annuus]|uniref:Uncharacterized protein n=1 Tax=Helianthus annuus TaxID=4232 RepID=A0A9K3J0Z0_HELAN|nr:hypothetical protein HanXRQr2_Chr05g0212421 [Helianthus annuus]KAJ0750093.1 hypothetical protein HanLR1_Chr05g0177941 [Helianthus annuus]
MVVGVPHVTFNYPRTRTLLVIVGFNKVIMMEVAYKLSQLKLAIDVGFHDFKLLTMIGNGAIGEPCRVIFMSKEPNLRR